MKTKFGLLHPSTRNKQILPEASQDASGLFCACPQREMELGRKSAG